MEKVIKYEKPLGLRRFPFGGNAQTYKDGHPHGRPYTHLPCRAKLLTLGSARIRFGTALAYSQLCRIGNKIYKTKEKFIEALKEL